MFLEFLKVKKGSLRANVASMFVANLCYAFFSWAQLSLVAKFTDGIILGNYTLAIAIITPLYLFSNMQLRSLIITDQKNKYDFSDYFTFRLISNVVMFLLVITTYFILNIGDLTVLLLFLGIKIVESNSDIINAFFQKNEEMHYVSISVFFKSLFGFIGMFLGLWFYSSIISGLILSLVLNSLVYLFYDRNISKRKKIFILKPIDVGNLKIILKTALPLGFVSCIIAIDSNLGKFFIEKMEGTEMQGIYSSIGYMIILGTFVCNAVGQSFSPRLSKYYLDFNIKAFKNLQLQFLKFNILVGVVACIITFFLGKYILLVFYNEEIASYYDLFNLVMVGGIFTYISTALGYTLTSMREFNIQPKIRILLLLLKLPVLWTFIYKYGVYGVAWAFILMSIINCVVSFLYINYRLNKLNCHD